MVMTYSFILAAFIILERLFELRLAARNQRIVTAMGAKEYGRGHYPLFFLLHVGWLVGWMYETLFYGISSELWYIWLILFLLAEVLRYWCISSLGPFWNTRILIVPGEKRVNRGPYRFMTHPNYLAVAIVLLAAPAISGAYITAGVTTVLNAALLLGVRIPEEERALRNLRE